MTQAGRTVASGSNPPPSRSRAAWLWGITASRRSDEEQEDHRDYDTSVEGRAQ